MYIFLGGEVMKYIYKAGQLSEEETRKFVRQIVSAIDHLHKAGIIHRWEINREKERERERERERDR